LQASEKSDIKGVIANLTKYVHASRDMSVHRLLGCASIYITSK